MRLALSAALVLCSTSALAAPLQAKAILYHYNLQYVAGGMNRFPDGISRDPNFNLSEEKVEDLIIAESFTPILDVLERHPTWHVDLELQGMMIEAMAARHKPALDKLRVLAKRGQVEVVSFHYSDQLFLAYPKRDLVRSVIKNRKVYETHDIPLSKVVFTQEGQFNEGMLKVMKENGWDTAVMASNLYGHLHGATPAERFFQRHGVDVVVSGGSTFSDLTVTWDGPGDGELIVTGQTNPYLGLQGFKTVPAEVKKWEDERAAEEAAGIKHLTVTELVAEAKARGTFPEMKPITDGSWRPKDTRNLFRWMGGLGGVWDLISNVTTERDDTVLRTNAQASIDVAACEAVVKWAAERSGHEARVAALEEAARELMLSEVSDSTGWNPWLGEVSYSLDHAQKAKDAAKRCIDAPELRGSNVRRIDLKTGEVVGIKQATDAGTPTPADAPFQLTIDAPGRTVTTKWSRISSERLELVVDATAGSHKNDHRLLSVTFPMAFDHVVYAPALDEENVVDLAPTEFAAGVEHSIPAPSGLVGLGPSRFLVKDVRVSHLAALVKPSMRQLEVRDETLHHDQPAHWRFEIVDADTARANELAHALNVTPVVEYPLEPRGGCGCNGAPGVALLALAAVVLGRRRG